MQRVPLVLQVSRAPSDSGAEDGAPASPPTNVSPPSAKIGAVVAMFSKASSAPELEVQKGRFSSPLSRTSLNLGENGYSTVTTTLKRDATGFGLSLQSSSHNDGKGAAIRHIVPSSPAARDGNLFVGDRLLNINGFNVENLTHEEVRRVEFALCSRHSPYMHLLTSTKFSDHREDQGRWRCPCDHCRQACAAESNSLHGLSSTAHFVLFLFFLSFLPSLYLLPTPCCSTC
jgi:hypothetical protein